MKKYFIDKRVLTNGSAGQLGLSNSINLKTYIERLIQNNSTPVVTQFTDTDGYEFNNNFNTTYTLQGIGAPIEGESTEVFVDANNFLYEIIINSEGTLYGGSGIFDPILQRKIMIGGDQESTMNHTKSSIQFDVESSTLQTSGNISISPSSISLLNYDGFADSRIWLVSDPAIGTLDIKSFDFNNLIGGGKLTVLKDGIRMETEDIVNNNISRLIVNGTPGALTTAGIASQNAITGDSMSLFLENDPVGGPGISVLLKIINLQTYADNAAALAGGLTTDCVYKTATGELRIVV